MNNVSTIQNPAAVAASTGFIKTSCWSIIDKCFFFIHDFLLVFPHRSPNTVDVYPKTIHIPQILM